MFELILSVGAAIAMSRFAEADRGEGLKWGAITFGLCLIAFFLVPLPFIRILLAIGVAVVMMTMMKKTYY